MFTREPGIAVIGRIPPPFGGVSVHLARLLERLGPADLPLRFYDLTGKTLPERRVHPGAKSVTWLVKFFLTCSETIVHLNTNRVGMMCLAAGLLRLRNRRLVITLHSVAPHRWYLEASFWKRWLWKKTVAAASHVICTNNQLREWIISLGVPETRTSVVPDFIPPTAVEVDPSNIPPAAMQFLGRHGPVIGSHGWFGYFVDGIHLYSFDMLASLLMHLREAYPMLGLYTVVSGTYDQGHRQQIYLARRELGLEEHWLILEQPFSSAALYARCDVFVRPSITDGDSVSIRECLALDKPVVASDSVERPAACRLFRNRDQDGLEEAVREVLGDPAGAQLRCRQSPVLDASIPIGRIYADLLSRNSS